MTADEGETAMTETVPEATRTDLDTSERPLLMRLNERGFRLVQLADALVLFAVMFGTALVRWGMQWPSYPMPLYLLSFTVAGTLYLVTYYFGGLYEREPRLGRPPVMPRAVRLSLAATGMFAVLQLAVTGIAQQAGFATARALPMPTPHLLALAVLGSGGVAANRLLVRWVRTRREGPPSVLLVGSPAEVEVAEEHLTEAPDSARVVGTTSDLSSIVSGADEVGATEVLLLASDGLEALYPDTMNQLEQRGINLAQRVGGKETMFGLSRVDHVGGLPFVLLRLHTLPTSRARLKRVTDVVLLIITAPVVLPVLFGVGLYQLVVAGRPILYRQARVGAGGAIFEMIKFRTMSPDAEADGVARLAERSDPRVIPGCEWIRATRLDELPQVFNVLRGEMSFVGPRPERPELTIDLEKRIPGYAHRQEIPPGITGLAQIQGRYHTDAEYKLGYDLQYLASWSPVLDLEILLRTMWVVVTRKL